MQKRSKRWIAIILTGILSLNLLAGCSAKPVPSQDTGVSNKESKEDASSQTDSTAESGQTDGEQVVRMWTFLDPAAADGRGKALGEIIQNFETENPNIKIVVEPQDWEQMTPKFFAAHAAGNAPDIIWCIMDEMGAALDLGALEPLENLFLKDWSEEEIADIDDSFFNFGTRDGLHYQITHSRNYMAFYTVQTFLRKKDYPFPRHGTSL